MKRTAKAELRAKSADDLAKEVVALREGMFKGRLTAAVEGKSLGGRRRDIRRQIARLETLIAEKKKVQA